MSQIDTACRYFSAPDEYACRLLVEEFTAAIDQQQYERLRAVFTEDAVYARPIAPDTLLQGLAAILAAFATRPASRITCHLVTNVSIRFDSADSARGRCGIVLYSSDSGMPESAGKGRKAHGTQLIGEYADRFVRTANGWRIAERRGRVLLHT